MQMIYVDANNISCSYAAVITILYTVYLCVAPSYAMLKGWNWVTEQHRFKFLNCQLQ